MRGRATAWIALALVAIAADCATPGPPRIICGGLIRPLQERVGDAVDFSVENTCFVPVAVELTFPVFDNVRSARDLPVRQVVPAHSKLRLTTLEPLKAHEKWSCRGSLAILYYGSSKPAIDPSTLYEFPFGGSESRVLVQGADGTFTHQGTHRYAYDFGMPIGTPVVAAREGTVVLVVDGFDDGGTWERYKERSNSVVVLQSDGTIASYGHLAKGIRIAPGTHVAAGDFLASSGNSGYSKGPHLHFEVNVQARPPEPAASIPVRFRGASALEEGRLYGPFRRPSTASAP